MPRPSDDDPYRDDSPRPARKAGAKGGASRKSAGRPRGGRKKSAATSRPAKTAARTKPVAHAKPAAQAKQPSRGRPAQAKVTHPAPAKKRRSRRGRGGGGGGSHRESQLTSHPTSRNAYVETRQWLLAEHGPVCAYCARSFTPRVMTLDHVAPRKGKTAYDRRDNLVLACPACNAAKRDLAPMAFLLGSRERAANLLRYGTHLSPMLVEMARALAPAGSAPEPPAGFGSWATLLDVDDLDPYRS